MYVYLSKILPVFVMPLGIVFLLCVVALILLKYRKRKIAMGVLGLALAVLWVASMPFVADSLYRSLESEFPEIPLVDVPNGGCIIVLGGTMSAPTSPRLSVDFHEGIDRVYKAAKLYREGRAPVIIVTGGLQPWSASQVAEADLIRDQLQEWGVAEDAIFLEGSSRNTRENALYSKNVIDAIACKDPLLVTSAAHMPRALAAFRGVGINAFPVSTDVRVVGKKFPVVMDFIPDHNALAQTSDAIREWIGQKVYSWNGWD